MLVNKELLQTESHVKFISYTGKWPTLCCGILTLVIDGVEVRFGSGYDDKDLKPKFWSSGGSCNMRQITTGEWMIDVEDIPEEYRKYAAEIDEVFNRNVEFGCCGGCR